MDDRDEIMSINQRLNEIATQIANLKEEQSKLLNEKKSLTEEGIKSLEWTKDCIGIFEILSWGGVGTGCPTYVIKVGGPSVPNTIKAITIMGDHSHSDYNMLFGSAYGGDFKTFYTCSLDVLLEFLKKVKFKKLDYNEKHLTALMAIKQYAEMGGFFV